MTDGRSRAHAIPGSGGHAPSRTHTNPSLMDQ